MNALPLNEADTIVTAPKQRLHAYLVLSDKPLPQTAFHNDHVVSVSSIPDLQSAAQLQRRLAPMPAQAHTLSQREEEVLGLIANGYTRYQAAKTLGISHNTVAKHIQSIYAKLDVSSVAEATQQAIAIGIVVV